MLQFGHNAFGFLLQHKIAFVSKRGLFIHFTDSGLLVQLTYRHRASSIEDRRFATLQRTLSMYLINKYISLSDICLNVHH